MHLVIRVTSGVLTDAVYVSVNGEGAGPGDCLDYRAVVEAGEVSEALYEARELALTWWEHGMLSVAAYSPVVTDWTDRSGFLPPLSCSGT